MKWEYTDNAGVRRIGTVVKTTDHGGSDITYFFRRETGEIDVINGLYLKRTGAHALWGKS